MCSSLPIQGCPKAEGRGLSQSLCRRVIPPPHEVEQSSHAPQDDQPPSARRSLNLVQTYTFLLCSTSCMKYRFARTIYQH